MLLQKLIDKRIESYQSELIEKYCAEVESMYTKMRGWRHDYHNHIQAMQASMALGRYEEVKEYLHQLNDDLTNVDTIIKTGQVMVDAILNGKLTLAAKNNIPLNVKARLPEKLSISTIDLCVIIGNLLDNAIEENINLPQEDRFIRIYIGVKNTQLYLCFTNAAGKRKACACTNTGSVASAPLPACIYRKLCAGGKYRKTVGRAGAGVPGLLL